MNFQADFSPAANTVKSRAKITDRGICYFWSHMSGQHWPDSGQPRLRCDQSLATGGEDDSGHAAGRGRAELKAVRWELATGKELFHIADLENSIMALRFTP